MWILISAISILYYALSSVFQKMGSSLEEEHTELKLLLQFGLFSGVLALGIDYLGLREGSSSVIEILAESPSAVLSPLLYLGSLFMSFVAYKYIPAHMEAPLSNTDGFFAFIGVLILLPFYNPIVFNEEVTPLRIICVFLLLATVFILYCVEARESNRELNRQRAEGHILGRGGNFAAVGVLIGLFGGFLDGASSLVDIILLGKFADSFDYIYVANVLSFFIGVVSWFLILILEKKPYNFVSRTEVTRMLGAGMDCLATCLYMVAVAENPIYAAPLISTNCVCGIILSTIILKEDLSKKKQLSIVFTLAAMFLFIAVDEFT